MSDDYATERKRASRGLAITGRPRESKDVLTEQAWRQEAACKGVDPEVFHPQVSQATTNGTKGQYGKKALRQINEAKSYCEACLVRGECLDYALTTNQEHGIWGGTDERERKALRRRRRAS